jgi:hypothetical protein
MVPLARVPCEWPLMREIASVNAIMEVLNEISLIVFIEFIVWLKPS